MTNKKYVLENYPKAIAVNIRHNYIEIQSPLLSGGYNLLGIGENKLQAWNAAAYSVKHENNLI